MNKTLFDMVPEWKKEWKGMPEYNQEKKEPYATIIIRFETEEDLLKFSKLIDQRLTPKTKSIWYPFKSHWGADHTFLRYVDES